MRGLLPCTTVAWRCRGHWATPRGIARVLIDAGNAASCRGPSRGRSLCWRRLCLAPGSRAARLIQPPCAYLSVTWHTDRETYWLLHRLLNPHDIQPGYLQRPAALPV